MDDLSKLEPRRQGELARLDGLPADLNPYARGSDQWLEWHRGWCQAQLKGRAEKSDPDK